LDNNKKVKILDCTIRDGGYVNNWDFPTQMVKDVFRQLSKAGVDIVEIGFRDSSDDSPLWRRCPDEVLKTIKGTSQGTKLSVMVDFGKATVDEFAEAAESPIDMVRVAVHRNNVEQALDLLHSIRDKGYLTSIQLMGYPQYTDNEKSDALQMFSDNPPHYVYVADSYGSLLPDQVKTLIEPLIEQDLFKVGFHPHNNLQLAFANTLEAIKAGVHIIDCTLYGMGRGAGNLPIETLLAYLQQKIENKFNVNPAIFCVDMYMIPLKKQYEWGYQLSFMLSGICQCHPYYSKELVEARRYTIGDIWKALRMIKGRNPIGFDRSVLQEVMDSGVFEYGLPQDGPEVPDAEKDEKEDIPSGPPLYMNRHRERPFLVLANGPSLRQCADDIHRFVRKYDPVILGANYLENVLIPHYHAFVNKKRFIQYVPTVSARSKLLVSAYFSEEFIHEYTENEYEVILYRRGDRNEFFIENGVVSNDCSSVSMLLVTVAIVMGAGEVYVAGMDGFLMSGEREGGFYFYEERDQTTSVEFNTLRQKWGERTLRLLDEYLVRLGKSGVNIITPTSYERYYVGINSLLAK